MVLAAAAAAILVIAAGGLREEIYQLLRSGAVLAALGHRGELLGGFHVSWREEATQRFAGVSHFSLTGAEAQISATILMVGKPRPPAACILKVCHTEIIFSIQPGS